MCGIIGTVKLKDSASIDPEKFSELVGSLRHRGPDDWGIHHDPKFSFGHRRLSIIDLTENARQPMSDALGEIWITFNGEIYNFPEIKDDLICKGHQFTNKSDTEVIIEAYKEWGIDCLHKLNGMFALGLYDRRTDEFYLVRDRLGVKPAYYSVIGDEFVFCSELKGIINYPGFKKELNLMAVSCYLSFRYCVGTETYFKGVSQIEPGHYVKISDGKQQIVKYWDIDLGKRKFMFTRRDKRKLKSLIGDAIRMRTISDVPLGSFLSGGIDSTIILNEMAKLGGTPVKTFTVTFGEKGYDESIYSTLAAERFGAQSYKINLSGEEYFKYVDELIGYKDQPLGYHNEVASYLMARELKKHVTVVLSGEGADEIFGGYGRLYRSPFDYKRLKLIGMMPRFMRKRLLKMTGLDEKSLGISQLKHFLDQYSYFPIEEKNEIYNDDMKKATANDERIFSLYENTFSRASHRSYYDKIAYTFEKLHLPGVMQMLDATSMATAVEARVPFVDYRIVQESFNIPVRYKMRWRSVGDFLRALFKPASVISEHHDVTKSILRELYVDDIPKEIIERKKMIFPVPLTHWFKGDYKEMVRRELLGPDSKIRAVFDQKKLESWICLKENGDDQRYGRKMWMILNLEFWLRKYF